MRLIYVFLSLLFFFMFHLTASAQKNTFELGIKGGINDVNLIRAGLHRAEKEDRKGITTGVSAQYNINKHWSFTTTFYYQRKNWAEIIDTFRFDYITIPATLKYHFGQKKYFYLEAGGYIDKIVNETSSRNSSYIYDNNKIRSKKTTGGFMAGAGINIPIQKKITLSLEINYTSGYTYIDFYNKVRGNTTNFLLGVSYRFGKEKMNIIDSSKANKKEKRFYTKLFYSPQITYRRDIHDRTGIKDYNDGESWANTAYDSKEEIPKYGYELGILFEFLVKKYLSINTGISTEIQGFETKKNITASHFGYGDFIGYWNYETNDNFFDYQFNYVSTPLIFNYILKQKGRTMLYLGTGLEGKLLYRSKLNNSTFNTLGQNNGVLYGSRFSAFGIANIGISFPTQSDAYVFLEPNFKFQLKAAYMPDKHVLYQLWSAGCKVGIKF